MAGSAITILESKPHYTGTTRVVSMSDLPYESLDKIYKVRIKTYRAGIAVIDKPSGGLLMVHQLASNNWGVPKGHRDPGETTALQTALRELEEETGIVATAGQFAPWVILIDLKYTNGVDLHAYYILPVDKLPDIRLDATELGGSKWINMQAQNNLQMSRPMELLLSRLKDGKPV
jgi:8-oxo-dGTP pyrophosphatase MutT (NUDIX family)